MTRRLAWLFILVLQLTGGIARGQECVPDELLVKFRPGTSTQARAAAHRALGATVRDRVQGLDVDVVALPARLTPAEAARRYAEIRAKLQSIGQPIGSNDLWIAAHALADELTLVTNNEREFQRVPGLRVENWTR